MELVHLIEREKNGEKHYRACIWLPYLAKGTIQQLSKTSKCPIYLVWRQKTFSHTLEIQEFLSDFFMSETLDKWFVLNTPIEDVLAALNAFVDDLKIAPSLLHTQPTKNAVLKRKENLQILCGMNYDKTDLKWLNTLVARLWGVINHTVLYQLFAVDSDINFLMDFLATTPHLYLDDILAEAAKYQSQKLTNQQAIVKATDAILPYFYDPDLNWVLLRGIAKQKAKEEYTNVS